MHEDFKWLVGVLLIFGVFWFVSRGFNNPASNTAFIAPGVDSGEVYYGGQNSGSSGAGQTGAATGKKLTPKEELAQSLADAAAKAAQVKKDLAALEEAKKVSPLSGKITFAGIGGGGSSASSEYTILRASNTNTQSVLITGLRLESSASGRGADIPKASYLPFQNQVNTESPVFLAPGETAYIITGRSPLGMSFRLNECTGFFNQYQTFNPGLPSRCPTPGSEPLPPPRNQWSDECLDYINSLPGCQVITSPPPTATPECRRYVTNELNYTKCVERHKNDQGFYDPTWRIYLGRDEPLWKARRELVNLLDQNGKVIDAVTY